MLNCREQVVQILAVWSDIQYRRSSSCPEGARRRRKRWFEEEGAEGSALLKECEDGDEAGGTNCIGDGLLDGAKEEDLAGAKVEEGFSDEPLWLERSKVEEAANFEDEEGEWSVLVLVVAVEEEKGEESGGEEE